jgi:serine/threonine-protein kinase
VPLKEGDTFDRYLIEAPLGQGGMGEVYRAYDPRLRRKIALKVLRLDKKGASGSEHEGSERLLREARVAAALDHPNAVSVFDVGEVDGMPYIAMELVKGATLRAFIGDASVSLERRVRWLVDIARALAAAHERGLVHRDVKPENVMIRDDGVVKVLDFGIAKQVKRIDTGGHRPPSLDLGGEPGDTVHGTVVGTPRYLAPEQVAGENVDVRTDQFAWGVVAYELLSGTPPWTEEAGMMKMMVAIASHHPSSLAKLVPALPPVVSATVARALSKRPEERFPKMTDVIMALEPFEAHSRRSLHDGAVSVATTKTDLERMQLPILAERERTPHEERRAPRLWVIVGATALAAAIAAAALALRHGPSRDIAATTSAAARRQLAVTDKPPPASASAEAVDAYRAAMQAFRDGTFEAVRDGLERAVSLDPSMAAANLRLAVFDSLVETQEPEAKKAYKRASQFRARLGEPDAALLDALEPYFQRDPSDPAECERRLRAAQEKWPDDAELAFFLGWIRYDLGRLESALEAFDRAIAIDPKFALAWSNKGGCQAYLGRFDLALESLERCLEISPQATESLWYRTIIFEQEGQCAREEEDARRWIGKDAEDAFAYSALSHALYAENKPLETVRAALEQKWAHWADEHRTRTETFDRALLDVLAGDFDGAEKEALALEKVVAGIAVANAHADPARLLVEIYRETGRDALARAIADRYVKRKDAWSPAHRVDDGAISGDPIPELLGVLAHAGALTPAELEQRRHDWLRGWQAKSREAYVHYLWVQAYAVPAETEDDAKTALDALPGFAPVPPFMPQTLALADVGRTYLLGGKRDDALPYLKKAAASCMALSRPIGHTRAHLHLGDALAQAGDARGACAAYKVVVDRWGSDKRSVSAKAARAKRAALRCD